MRGGELVEQTGREFWEQGEAVGGGAGAKMGRSWDRFEIDRTILGLTSPLCLVYQAHSDNSGLAPPPPPHPPPFVIFKPHPKKFQPPNLVSHLLFR